MTPPLPEPKPRARRRVGRLVGALARGLLWSLLVVAVAIVLVVRNLDSQAVKRRVQALVHDQAGLDLDYETTHLALSSGFHVTGVRLLQPGEFRALAPELLRIDAIDVGWSFVDGSTPVHLEVRGVEITLVEEGGRTSLDALGPPAPAPAHVAPGSAAQPLALSTLARDVLKHPPLIERVRVDGVALNFVEAAGGRVVRRARLAGLSAHGEAQRDGASHRLAIDLGTPSAPLALTLSDERDGRRREAEARLAATLMIAASSADATIDLELVRQSFAPSLPQGVPLLRLDAQARFDAAHRATRVAVARLDAAGGAWSSELDVELADAGAPPIIRRAAGTLDAARLLHLLPLEPGRAELREGKLRFTASALELDAPPRLAESGKLDVEGAIAGLRLASGGRVLSVARGKLVVRGTPRKNSTHFLVELPLSAVHAEDGAERLDAAALDADVEARVPPHGALDVTARARFKSIDVAAGGAQVSARDGHAEAHVSELHVDAAAPLASRGALSLEGAVAAAAVTRGKLRLGADDLSWNLRTRLGGKPPYALDCEMPIGKLRVAGARGPLVPPTAARIALHVDHVAPDGARPSRSTGDGKLDVDLGSLKISLVAVKRADAADFTLAADGSSLALLRFVAPERFAVPWERMTLALRSSGTVDKFAAPRLKQKTSLQLGHAAFGDTVAASGVELRVESAGTLDREDATADVRLAGLVLDRKRVGDGHATLVVGADRAHPSITLRFDGQGDAGPQGTLAVDARFDGATRGLVYRVDGKLARLGLLEPFLGAVPQVNRLDLGVLGVQLHGEGTLYGLVDAVRGGVPVLAAHPLATLHGDDATEVRLDHVRYAADDADLEVSAPSITVTTAIHADGDRRRAQLDVEAPRVTVDTGGHQVSVDGLRDHLELTARGDPLTGAAELTHDVKAHAVHQDFVAAYPIGALAASMRLEHDGATLKLTRLALDNPAGGTRLAATGAIELNLREPAAGRGLAVEGTLTQKLEGLSGVPAELDGHGLVSLALRVESGDLALYHAMASLRVDNAELSLPRKHLHVAAVDGEIPIAEDVVRGRRGFELVGRATDQTYPQLRFADQHPFLSGRSFISMALLSTDSFVVGPLAGNLRVDRNLVSLDQLEMAVRNGRVTGQCILDYRGAKSALQLRVRASHVESSHGGVTEPFDGNAALTVSLAKRSIEGRAEIIHIGRHHLLDLLDLYDPHHTDVPTNRLRKALGLGYPDRARLLFDRGFASLLVEFGGLARLVRVDEVRGIPTGPIVDKYLGPLLSAEGDHE